MTIRKPTVSHILVLMFGLSIVAFGFYARATEWAPGIGIPAFGAVIVAFGVGWLMPKLGAAGLVATVVALASFKVKSARDADKVRWAGERAANEMLEVCKGKPMPSLGAPNTKMRWVFGYRGPGGTDGVSWLSRGEWNPDRVPEFVVCVDETQETVHSGSFTASDGVVQTRSTFRHHADVTLRRTVTAEILFTKHYRGSNPPPLPTYIGSGTVLDGSVISSDEILVDIKPHLGSEATLAQRR